MPKITVTLDSADIDPLDTGARRQYMNVFFASTPISSSVIQKAHTKAIELQSKHLFGKGLSDVNVAYFEYHVDMTQWRLITNLLMITKNNPWPWTVSINESDLSQGTSPVFREWFSNRQQATPRSQPQGPVPQTRAEAEEMAFETIQRANELDREGFHLRRIARQWPLEDGVPPQDHDRRDFSGTKPLEGRAMKRKLAGGEEQDVENLSNENNSTSASSSCKRARLDKTSAAETSLKVEDSQDEPLAPLSMAPPHHQSNRKNSDE